MKNLAPLRADLKLIFREPILIIFTVLPVFIFLIFKLILIYGAPIIYRLTGVDLSSYYGYILALGLLMTPSMLGTVSAFLMIDERDAKIYELISITPVNYKGYIKNRLVLPLGGSIIYTFIGYFILDIFYLSPPVLIYSALICGLGGVLAALLLFSLAQDKVQGLTYSKGLSILAMLAIADIINISWLSKIAALTPFYWITRMINSHGDLLTALMSIIVPVLWIAAVVKVSRRY